LVDGNVIHLQVLLMRDLIYSGWRLKPAVSALIGFVQRAFA
jgi:hypothetical protein